ncbi:MAG: amidohydrolase family protein, partial [Lysobacter sp.]
MIAYLLGLAIGAAAPATPSTAAAVETQPAGTWVVRDVTVIPVDTDEVLAHRTVLIRDGKIAKILPQGAKAKIKDAQVVDGSGKFLLPGFVDAHVHIATEGAIRTSKDAALSALDLGTEHRYDRQIMLSFLKAGVTGAANLGGSVGSDDDLLRLRGEIDAGRFDGPKLYVGKLI